MTKRATRFIAGTNSRRSSSRFGTTSPRKKLTPVTLPPGRERLATRPSWTGSSGITNTIGMVVVAALAATAGAVPPDGTMTATCLQIRSVVSAGGRSSWFSAQRYSMAASHLRHKLLLLNLGEVRAPLRVERRAPRIGSPVSPCCARAASGQYRRATKQRDEPTAVHSITSSAMASSEGGIVRPSILAVGWLMTSSNLVDCSTGRSAGLVPLRIRPL